LVQPSSIGTRKYRSFHVRDAQDPGLSTHVDPGGRVEGVGVRRGHVTERCIRILAGLDEAAHRAAVAFRRRDVGHDAPRVFHGHQWVPEDVGVSGEPEVLETFTDVQQPVDLGAALGAHPSAGKGGESSEHDLATGDIHGEAPHVC
jgi:hypothetical protein